MRSSEPLRRLLKPSVTHSFSYTRAASPVCRCIHSSRRLQERKPPRSRTQQPYTDHLIPQDKLTVRHAKPNRRYTPKSTKGILPYTSEELKEMKKRYTSEQMAALMAGEEAISPQDVADQGVLLSGPMTLDYLDDFSEHRPVVDKSPEGPSVRDPKTGRVPKFRWKDDRDLADDLEDWLDEQPSDGGDPKNWIKFLETNKLYDSKTDLDNARTAVAPEIFPIDDPVMQAQARASKAKQGKQDDLLEGLEAIAKQTGLELRDIKTIEFKTLVTRFVTNQTRLGKQMSVYNLTIAGNRNGMLGIGEGKSQIGAQARKKSALEAVKNMVPIPRYENRTIYGNVKGKSGATELELYARHPGFGSRGSHLIWEMCKFAGIKDISARVTRSRTPMNVVKAAFNALRSQRDPEEIAIARGRRMVDLRKVYYAGGNS